MAREKYSDEFKQEVFKRLDAGESRSAIAREMGLKNCALISKWVRDKELDDLRAENERLRYKLQVNGL